MRLHILYRAAAFMVALISLSSMARASDIDFKVHDEKEMFWCFLEAQRLTSVSGGSFVSTITPMVENTMVRPSEVEREDLYAIWVLQADGSRTALICTKGLAFQIKNPKPASLRLGVYSGITVERNTAGCRERPLQASSKTVSVAFDNEKLQVSWISYTGEPNSRGDRVQFCFNGFDKVTFS